MVLPLHGILPVCHFGGIVKMPARTITGVLLSFTLASLGCSSSTAPWDYTKPPSDAVEIQFTRLEEVPGVPLVDSRRQAIRDSATWFALSNGNVAPVSFDLEMVVLVAAGIRPNSGYGITIEHIYDAGGNLWVEVVEWILDDSCGVISALTTPWDAAAVPQGADFVIFYERKSVVSCD